LGSDLEEFLWTYDDDATYEDYPAEIQKTAEDVLSFLREKLKSLESEASESKPKFK
jgi:hypothetical protein